MPAFIISYRTIASAGLLWLAFICSFLFFGIGENLLLLWIASGFLLLALLVQPLEHWKELLTRPQLDSALCCWVLLALVASQLWLTIEPETSFAVGWILASAPLCYLAGAGLADRRLLRWLVVGTVGVFAAVSAARFLAGGVRAYEPLADPNSYACLLYLVWIPLAHRFLLLAWRGEGRATLAAQAAPLLVLLIALFATKSRAGSAIAAGAIAGWFMLALRHRFSLKPVLLLSVLTAASYALVIALAPDAAQKFLDQGSLADGVSVRSALNSSAWRIYLEAPLVGHGVFSFPQLYPLFRSLDDQGTAGMFVHNDYLQLMAEAGLLLVFPVLVLLLATLRWLLLTLLRSDEERLPRYGVAMAIVAALSHATINFIVYILPLTLLIAALCVELYRPERRVPAPASALPGSWAAGGGIMLAAGAFGLVAWLHLGLDVVTQVVFAGQPGPPVVQQLRANPQSMRDYAELAQRVNGRRVTPVLGEALVNAALLDSEGGGLPRKLLIRDQFRRALAMDPLNPLGYEQYYQFLMKAPDRELFETLRKEESPAALLQRAVELDVRQATTILELVSLYDRLGASSRGDALLEADVLPWLRLIHQTDPRGAKLLLDEAVRRAQRDDDTQRVEELRELWESVRGALEPPEPNWLRDLLLAA